MAGLAGKLKPIPLKPEQLLLDPNNPRYQGDFLDWVFVPYDQVAEQEHQDRAMKRILSDRFGVRRLAESIAQVGYLPIDNLVVTPYPGGKYLIVEGNRRLAAIHLILDKSVECSPENLETVKELPALVLEVPHKEASIEQWLLQGTRHIGGVKQWGPYQKARAIQVLEEERGLSPDEAAAALGMKPGELRRSQRALLAYYELTAHPQFGRRARVDKFSCFEELVKKPVLRDYFGWSNAETRFVDPGKRDLLFRLIMGSGGRPPKVPTGQDLRRIAKVLKVPEAQESLEDFTQPLERAFDLVSTRNQKLWVSSLMFRLKQTVEDLARIQGQVLDSGQRAVLREVRNAINTLLKRR